MRAPSKRVQSLIHVIRDRAKLDVEERIELIGYLTAAIKLAEAAERLAPEAFRSVLDNFHRRQIVYVESEQGSRGVSPDLIES